MEWPRHVIILSNGRKETDIQRLNVESSLTDKNKNLFYGDSSKWLVVEKERWTVCWYQETNNMKKSIEPRKRNSDLLSNLTIWEQGYF